MIDHLDLQAIEAQREIDASRVLRQTGAAGNSAPHRTGGESRRRHAAAHIRAAWAALTSHPDRASETARARTS